jgi:hypothetical protein
MHPNFPVVPRHELPSRDWRVRTRGWPGLDSTPFTLGLPLPKHMGSNGDNAYHGISAAHGHIIEQAKEQRGHKVIRKRLSVLYPGTKPLHDQT